MDAASDATTALCERVLDAHARRQPLAIRGGAGKSFLGNAVTGEELDVRVHRGVVAYEPAELVITARAGTPLADIEAVLAGERQMLAFEPPGLGSGATLGGTIACGLSGPRRPYAGSARDFVLGVRMINGRGELLRFGGQVMKNVAGFDVARLMAGAQGTLGVLLDVSLKVLPRPECSRTQVLACTAEEAIAAMNRHAAQPLPLAAASHHDGLMHLRLEGAAAAVDAAARRIGGDELADAAAHWEALRELRLPFFASDLPLWRLSVPPAAPLPDLPGVLCIDWGGAQRWLLGEAVPERVQACAAAAGGHAQRIRGGDPARQPLAPAMHALQQRIKHAFDPERILNPGRLYADI